MGVERWARTLPSETIGLRNTGGHSGVGEPLGHTYVRHGAVRSGERLPTSSMQDFVEDRPRVQIITAEHKRWCLGFTPFRPTPASQESTSVLDPSLP